MARIVIERGVKTAHMWSELVSRGIEFGYERVYNDNGVSYDIAFDMDISDLELVELALKYS